MSGLVTVIKGALEELEGAEALLEEMAGADEGVPAMGLLAVSARLTSGRARLETLVEMLRSPGAVRYNEEERAGGAAMPEGEETLLRLG